MDAGSLIVILIFGVPLAAVIGVIFLLALKIIKSGADREARSLAAEEAQMVQEIHQSLESMDRRIEALETILLEDSNEEEKGKRQ
jgi:phage shock protein B